MHFVFALAFFSFGYFVWSRLIERAVGVDCIRPTPSIEKYDRRDFIPTKPIYLFVQHFPSLVGFGTLVGPILALKFGWVPTILWLVFGVVFVGSVHDFASLMLSLRHGGGSMKDIIRRYFGVNVEKMYNIFSITAISLMIAVFSKITSASFDKNPYIASSCLFFILFSLSLGFIMRFVSLPMLIYAFLSLLFICGSIFLGIHFPIHLSREVWIFIMIFYCIFTSFLPSWLIFQPRNLSGFLILILFVILGVSGFATSSPKMNMPAFPDNLSDIFFIFPMLFVTVACGAVSGFHSFTATNRTARHVSSECHVRQIGYGSMLLEALTGIISLTAVSILTKEQYISLIGEKGEEVVSAFSFGMFYLTEKLPIPFPYEFLRTFFIFSLLVLAFNSIDIASRFCRQMLEDLIPSSLSKDVHGNRFRSFRNILIRVLFSSSFLALISASLIFSGGFDMLWVIFGTANQLLASFTLITAWVWAAESNYKIRFFALPTIFLLISAMSALLIESRIFLKEDNLSLFTLTLILLFASAYIVFSAFRKIISASFAEREETQE